jgi:UDP-glucose 4-epimerase
MKTLITGGAGFIGSHLSEYLLAAGRPVTVLDDLSTGRLDNIARLLEEDDFSFVQGSILNEPLVDQLVGQADLVIHLAAVVGVQLVVQQPLRTIETNIRGTEAVLKAAQAHHKKVMLASTSEVYGKGVSLPFREADDRRLGPTHLSRWSYAASKALDEFLAFAYHQEYGLPVVIFRLFNTVGPRQTGRYGMVIPRFVRQALRDEPLTIYGDGSQSRCFCDVADVVPAIDGLAQAPTAIGQVFNIGSAAEVSIADLARQIIVMTGSRSTLQFIPYDEAYGPGFEDMQRRVPDTSKIKQAIGWQATRSLAQILEQVIAYERPFV